MSGYDQQGYAFQAPGESYQDTAVSSLFTDSNRADRLCSAIDAARSGWENSLERLRGGSYVLLEPGTLQRSLDLARQAASSLSDAFGGARTETDIRNSLLAAESLASVRASMNLGSMMAPPQLYGALDQMAQEFDQSMKPYHEALVSGNRLPQAIDQMALGQLEESEWQGGPSKLDKDEEMVDVSSAVDQTHSEDDDMSAFGRTVDAHGSSLACSNPNTNLPVRTRRRKTVNTCTTCEKMKIRCVPTRGLISTCVHCDRRSDLRPSCNRGRRGRGLVSTGAGAGSEELIEADISKANSRLDVIEEKLRALWLAKKGQPLPADLTQHSSWTKSK